jgi:predicted nucleic acid-binding protein
MSLFEDVMSLAVQLPTSERERLGRALGLSVHTKGPGKTLPLNQFVNRPDLSNPQAWRKAETGHAVLNTEGNVAGQASAPIQDGPSAIQNIWSHRAGEVAEAAPSNLSSAASLPKGHPVVVHTGVCTALALGESQAVQFFTQPSVEIRLATATYLSLLDAAENEEQVNRLRAFVQPFAVLSLGPMASSRAAELMLLHTTQGLTALDALVAATALAHEIPLLVREPGAFTHIAELQVVTY